MPGTLLAFLQFCFALSWVVYVIYLPALAEQAHIERKYVPMILMMDQLIFLACDWAAGMYADKAGRLFGRIGGTMAIATLVSCVAFILMPFAAPAWGATAFLFLTVLWSATSSALRAPSMALVARHAPMSKQPLIAGMYLFGLGVASAIAPYLGIELRQMDPRIPFALSSIALGLFTYMLSAAEKGWVAASPPKESQDFDVSRSSVILFTLAVLLFAFGFQVHFVINSAPSYLRFARMEDLPKLMPVFWIGFNLAILPATLLPKRFGGAVVMAGAGALGAVALVMSVRANTLESLLITEGIAGAAWAVAVMSAFTTALEAGHIGREGTFAGILFSTLAAAALVRIGILAGNLQANASFGPQLVNIPIATWIVASIIVTVLALRDTRPA